MNDRQKIRKKERKKGSDVTLKAIQRFPKEEEERDPNLK